MTKASSESPELAARVLVIDDEVQIRRFLRISLASQGYEVIEAPTGELGLELAAIRAPDLVVLDLGLPGMDGKEVLAELRGWSSVPVIILSVRADEGEKVQALDAGANDYVVKPFGLQEFLARARNLLRARPPEEAGSGIYQDGYLTIDLPRRRITIEGQEVHLTRREFDVLKMLLAHKDRVVTQTQLLREIWGPARVQDTHYLRIIIGRLRHKLRDDPTDPRYLITEPGVGYRLATHADDS